MGGYVKTTGWRPEGSHVTDMRHSCACDVSNRIRTATVAAGIRAALAAAAAAAAAAVAAAAAALSADATLLDRPTSNPKLAE